MRTLSLSRTIALAGLAVLGTASRAQAGTPAPAFVIEAKLLGRDEPGALAGDRYGTSVAISGDIMAVGVPNDETAAGVRAGSVLLFEREGTGWVQRQKVNLGPNGSLEGYQFGLAVALDGDVLVVGTAVSRIYVFERRTTWMPVADFFPAPDDASEGFGTSVTVSGDTIAVGVPEAEGPNTGAGAVYVFARSTSGTWSQQQRLTTSGPNAGRRLGASLAVAGDVLVAGAPGADNGTGHAVVFARTGGTWTDVWFITPPAGAAGDAFGTSVAYDGATLVVGAPGDDGPSGPADRGAAYAFSGTGQNWSAPAELLAASAVAGHGLGRTVAVSGDVALVGAPFANLAGAALRGAVDSFRRAGAAWGAPQRLTNAGGDALDQFGGAVAVDGGRAAVGAPGEESAAGEAVGAVYTFEDAGAQWGAGQALVPSFGTEGDGLGGAVAIDGDTAVAGAPTASTQTASWAGYAYVYVRQGIAWSEQQRLEAPDAVQYDFFGTRVAISGDTIAVAATRRDSGAVEGAGAVYVFERAGGIWTYRATIEPLEPTFFGGFGISLALAGDTIAVGSADATVGGERGRGRVDVFMRSGGTWVFSQTLTANDGAANDFFGGGLAMQGDTLVIGASGRDGASANTGAAYVFTRSLGAWNQGPRFGAVDGTGNDAFGAILRLSGNTLAVGVPNDGSVYMFERSGATFVQQQKLVPSGPTVMAFGSDLGFDGTLVAAYARNDLFAGVAHTFVRDGLAWVEGPRLTAPDASIGDGLETLAVSGDTIVAGKPRDDQPGEPNSGAAYVFRVQRSDVSVTLTNDQATTVPGTPVTYTLVARNAGIHPIETARVMSTAPAALLDVSWTCVASPGGACGASGTGNINEFPTLPVGGTATYTIAADVDPASTGTLTHFAGIFPPGDTDPNPANNNAIDVDTLTPRTDLALALTSVPTAVGAGALITWTTDVTNLGASTSTGSVLVHDLAAHATIVSVAPPPPTCVASAGSVTCAFGATAPGAARRLTVVQRVEPDYLGPIVAQSTVTASETDPVASNNQQLVEIEVIPPGDAEVAHGTSLLAPMAPGGARYRISLRPYSSYEAIVDATSGDIGGAAGPSLTLASATSTVVTGTPVGTGSSRALRWRNDGSTVVDDLYVRVASESCTTDCGPDDVYRLRVYDTTLTAPRFNNVGGQGTVLVLQNQGTAAVSGRAYFWTAGGTLLATAPFDLLPRGTLALATATVPGLAGASGTLTVAHDGGYGVLTGKAVALDPATGASFDTPLSSRSR
jgi:uncharacterized repeat protein (TIGR01451 family)